MIVTRKSVLTGTVRTRNIPVKPDDLKLYESGAVSLMDAMPYLNPADREFVMCGITENEFKNAFSKELHAIVNDKVGFL